MLINEANLDAIRVGFDNVFMTAFDAVDESQLYVTRIANVRPSTTRKTRFGMAARLPKMREWGGERQFNNMTEYVYELEAKDYEDSVEVEANAIREDNLGIYSQRLTMLGGQARKHPDDLAVTLLQNGHTASALCYDGQSFFDTDHPKQKGVSGSQQNYWSSGKALTLENAMAVRAVMMSYQGDDLRPLGVTPRLLIVPPALEHVAMKICNATLVENTAGATPAAGTAGMENVAKGIFSFLTMPELAGADTTWYLMDESKSLKPLVVVENEGIVSEMLGPGSDHYFRTKKIAYGVSWRGTAGYGAWFCAAKAVA